MPSPGPSARPARACGWTWRTPVRTTWTTLGACLGIHPLVIEDIAERNQRAKVEFTDDVMHLVVFALVYRETLEPVELDIVLGKRLPAHLAPARVAAHSARGSVERHGPAHFLAKGPDVALYAVLDTIVDGYFPMVDRLSEVTDELEDLVIQQPDRQVIERLFGVRRNLLLVRKVVTPEREVLNQLTNRENELIASDDAGLLPRRVRPPGARHRRARHPSRDAVERAGGIPVDGQQQPVGDHEAADRRDRGPGRDRCGRRASSA